MVSSMLCIFTSIKNTKKVTGALGEKMCIKKNILPPRITHLTFWWILLSIFFSHIHTHIFIIFYYIGVTLSLLSCNCIFHLQIDCAHPRYLYSTVVKEVNPGDRLSGLCHCSIAYSVANWWALRDHLILWACFLISTKEMIIITPNI